MLDHIVIGAAAFAAVSAWVGMSAVYIYAAYLCLYRN